MVIPCILSLGFEPWTLDSSLKRSVVPGNKSGIVLLVLGGKDTLGMFDPVL